MFDWIIFDYYGFGGVWVKVVCVVLSGFRIFVFDDFDCEFLFVDLFFNLVVFLDILIL